MNVHKNARLTPLGRERIVRQVACGWVSKVEGVRVSVFKGSSFGEVEDRVSKAVLLPASKYLFKADGVVSA